MWYVLWTVKGTEEKTRDMVNQHMDPALFTRCIVPYRRKREFYKGKSAFVCKLLFPSYLFIETDQINEFSERLQWFPGKNQILRTGAEFCPIYPEEEYFLTDMLEGTDIVESSEGYMMGDRVKVVSGPLRGYEDRIRRLIARKSLAILEMTLYERKVETALGLDLCS